MTAIVIEKINLLRIFLKFKQRKSVMKLLSKKMDEKKYNDLSKKLSLVYEIIKTIPKSTDRKIINKDSFELISLLCFKNAMLKVLLSKITICRINKEKKNMGNKKGSSIILIIIPCPKLLRYLLLCDPSGTELEPTYYRAYLVAEIWKRRMCKPLNPIIFN